MRSDQPNVLLVVLDTARADAVEPYGAAAGTTPAVADLAARGTAVQSAYAPSSWTLPSHAAMFSGLSPRRLGLGQSPDGRPAGCRPLVEAHADRWLPEVLRSAGWATRAVSSNVWVSQTAGFGQGFGEFAQVSGLRPTGMAESGARAQARWAAHAVRARADAGAAEARRHVSRWLEEDPSSPFFWFVNLLECHSPYLPPRPWNDLGPVARLRAGQDAREHLTLHAIWRASLTGAAVPADVLARLRHLYQRSVSMMDDWLAGVLEELDRQHRLDDTVVIVTSDHGENFGEDGLMGHAFSVDERLVRIPLVVAGPGSWDAAAVTSLVDLPRLLCAALGVTGPYDDDERTPGVAVSTFDPLASADAPETADAIARWSLDDRGIGRLTRPATAVTDGRWKLVRDPLGTRAYGLAGDPLGLSALPVDAIPHPARGALSTALEHAELSTPAAAAGSQPLPAGDADVEALEAQLRLLGYL